MHAFGIGPKTNINIYFSLFTYYFVLSLQRESLVSHYNNSTLPSALGKSGVYTSYPYE